MTSPKASVSSSGTAKTSRPPVNRIPAPGTKTGYRSVEKDPDLLIMVGLILERGWTPERVEDETSKIGRKVSRHCINGWIYSDVKRPQNYTLTSVAMAMGIERTWSSQPSAASLKMAANPVRKKKTAPVAKVAEPA